MKLNKIYILLNTLIIMMLGASISLNFFLYHQAKKYYFELNGTRLDPFGLSYFPVRLETIRDAHRIRVVFFGDSRAASWIPPDLNVYEFINRGISSQTSIQNIQRFPFHVRPLKPDIIILQVGVNDLKTIGLFSERRQAIVADCKANIKRLVEEAKNLGAVVIITTIFPTGDVPLIRKPLWSDAIGQAVQEVNTYIATLADEKTIVFDTFPILADSRGVLLQKYRLDELHLNGQGYEVLNKELVQLIDAVKRSKM